MRVVIIVIFLALLMVSSCRKDIYVLKVRNFGVVTDILVERVSGNDIKRDSVVEFIYEPISGDRIVARDSVHYYLYENGVNVMIRYCRGVVFKKGMIEDIK